MLCWLLTWLDLVQFLKSALNNSTVNSTPPQEPIEIRRVKRNEVCCNSCQNLPDDFRFLATLLMALLNLLNIALLGCVTQEISLRSFIWLLETSCLTNYHLIKNVPTLGGVAPFKNWALWSEERCLQFNGLTTTAGNSQGSFLSCSRVTSLTTDTDDPEGRPLSDPDMSDPSLS